MLRAALIALAAAACLAGVASAQALPAKLVLGQAGFTDGAAGSGQAGLRSPAGACVAGGKLFVVDQTNHRVLIWNTVPASSGVQPDVVLGQADFTGTSANRGTGANLGTFNTPTGVSSDGTVLVVGDAFNNRALLWNAIPTQNGVAADIVLGQASGSGTSSNRGGAAAANTINRPESVLAAGGRVYVSDTANNRVLIWNSIPTSNGAAADVVLGQANFTGTSANRGASAGANTLRRPHGLATVSSRLFVADLDNNRVLVWNSIPSTNGAAADLALGQTSLTQTSNGVGASKLNLPLGVSALSNRLAVTDLGNKRVLVWSPLPTVNGEAATAVVGQPDLNTGSSPTSITGSNLDAPVGVGLSGSELFVTDYTRNRILGFQLAGEFSATLTFSKSNRLYPAGPFAVTATFSAVPAATPTITLSGPPAGPGAPNNGVAAQAMAATADPKVFTFARTLVSGHDGTFTVTLQARDSSNTALSPLTQDSNTFTIDTAGLDVGLTYSKPTASVGAGPLVITASFVNEAPASTPTIAIDAPGTANDVPATPMVAGRSGTEFVFTANIQAGANGQATVTIGNGRDAAGNPNKPATNASFTINVSVAGPASLSIGAATLPAHVSQGQTFSAAVIVTNTGGTTADITSSALVFSGTGLTATPLSAVPSIAPGVSATFRFDVAVAAAATPAARTAQFTVRAKDRTNNADVSKVSQPLQGTVTVQTPASLAFGTLTAPSSAKVGTTFSASVIVSNVGGATAGITSTSLVFDGFGLTASSAGSVSTIAGGATATFGYSVQVAQSATPGLRSAKLSVRARDLNSSGDISKLAQALTPGVTVTPLQVAPVIESLVYSRAPNAYRPGETLELTATFDQDITPTAASITITGGSVGGGSVSNRAMTQRGNRRTWGFSIQLAAGDPIGSRTVVIAGATAAGLRNSTTPNSSFSVVAPTPPALTSLEYSAGGQGYQPGTTVVLTATFDQDITPTAASITITGGSVGGSIVTNRTMTPAATRRVWTFSALLVTSDLEGARSVTIRGANVSGLANSVTPNATFRVAAPPPVAAVLQSVTYRSQSVFAGETLLLTATFDQAIEPRAPAISITGGLVGGRTVTDATMTQGPDKRTWTFSSVISESDARGARTVRISGSGPSGLPNASTPNATFNVSLPPAPKVLSLVYDRTPAEYVSGETLTLTVTFDRPVAAGRSLITISGGTVGGLSIQQSRMDDTSNSRVCTFRRTISQQDALGQRTVAVSSQDAFGQSVNASFTDRKFSVIVRRPALVSLVYSRSPATYRKRDTLTLTATFSQDILPSPARITITGGSVESINNAGLAFNGPKEYATRVSRAMTQGRDKRTWIYSTVVVDEALFAPRGVEIVGANSQGVTNAPENLPGFVIADSPTGPARFRYTLAAPFTGSQGETVLATVVALNYGGNAEGINFGRPAFSIEKPGFNFAGANSVPLAGFPTSIPSGGTGRFPVLVRIPEFVSAGQYIARFGLETAGRSLVSYGEIETPFSVREAAHLSVSELTLSTGVADTTQRGLRIDFLVSNTGASSRGSPAAVAITGTPLLDGATAGLSIAASPGNATELSSGRSARLTFTVDLQSVPEGRHAVTPRVSARTDGSSVPAIVSAPTTATLQVGLVPVVAVSGLQLSNTAAVAGQSGLRVSYTIDNVLQPGIRQGTVRITRASIKLNGQNSGFLVSPDSAGFTIANGASARRELVFDLTPPRAGGPRPGTVTIEPDILAVLDETGVDVEVRSRATASLQIGTATELALSAFTVSRVFPNAGFPNVLRPGESALFQITGVPFGSSPITVTAAGLTFSEGTGDFDVRGFPAVPFAAAPGSSVDFRFNVKVATDATPRTSVKGGLDIRYVDAVSGQQARVTFPDFFGFQVPAARPPTAGIRDTAAGATAGQLVRLDGGLSADPDARAGDALVYRWSFVSKPAGSALDDRAFGANNDVVASQTTFIPDVAGDYVVGLVVSNGRVDSTRATAAVRAFYPEGQYFLASRVQAVRGQRLELAVRALTELPPDALPVFTWSFASLPPGSRITTAAFLPNASTAASATSFTPDAVGRYLVDVAVGSGSTVQRLQSEVVATEPNPQVAFLTPLEGDILTDDITSTIGFQTRVTFRTTAPAGSQVTLSADGVPVRSLTVPATGGGVFTIQPVTLPVGRSFPLQLTVGGQTATVNVQVAFVGRPAVRIYQEEGLAFVGNDKGTALSYPDPFRKRSYRGYIARMFGTRTWEPSFDDTDPRSVRRAYDFRWELTSIPSQDLTGLLLYGGTSDFEYVRSARPAVYTLRVTATDPVSGLSSSDSLTYEVLPGTPSAEAGPDRNLEIAPGANAVQLNGSASTTSGNQLTYYWSILKTPDRSAGQAETTTFVTLSSRTDPAPTAYFSTSEITPRTLPFFVAIGQYKFGLKVSDGSVVATDTVDVYVSDPRRVAPTISLQQKRQRILISYDRNGLVPVPHIDPPYKPVPFIPLYGWPFLGPVDPYRGGKLLVNDARLTWSGRTSESLMKTHDQIPEFVPAKDSFGDRFFTATVDDGFQKATAELKLTMYDKKRPPAFLAAAKYPNAVNWPKIHILEEDNERLGKAGGRTRHLDLPDPPAPFVLDGSLSASLDPANSTGLTYLWTQVGGPSVGLDPAETAPIVSFTPPEDGYYKFRLSVTDSNGTESSTLFGAYVSVDRKPLPALSMAVFADNRQISGNLPSAEFPSIVAECATSAAVSIRVGVRNAGRYVATISNAGGPLEVLSPDEIVQDEGQDAVFGFRPELAGTHILKVRIFKVVGGTPSSPRLAETGLEGDIYLVVEPPGLPLVPIVTPGPSTRRIPLPGPDGNAAPLTAALAAVGSIPGEAPSTAGEPPTTFAYRWSQIDGPLGSIDRPFSPECTFTAPDVRALAPRAAATAPAIASDPSWSKTERSGKEYPSSSGRLLDIEIDSVRYDFHVESGLPLLVPLSGAAPLADPARDLVLRGTIHSGRVSFSQPGVLYFDPAGPVLVAAADLPDATIAVPLQVRTAPGAAPLDTNLSLALQPGQPVNQSIQYRFSVTVTSSKGFESPPLILTLLQQGAAGDATRIPIPVRVFLGDRPISEVGTMVDGALSVTLTIPATAASGDLVSLEAVDAAGNRLSPPNALRQVTLTFNDLAPGTLFSFSDGVTEQLASASIGSTVEATFEDLPAMSFSLPTRSAPAAGIPPQGAGLGLDFQGSGGCALLPGTAPTAGLDALAGLLLVLGTLARRSRR